LFASFGRKILEKIKGSRPYLEITDQSGNLSRPPFSRVDLKPCSFIWLEVKKGKLSLKSAAGATTEERGAKRAQGTAVARARGAEVPTEKKTLRKSWSPPPLSKPNTHAHKREGKRKILPN